MSSPGLSTPRRRLFGTGHGLSLGYLPIHGAHPSDAEACTHHSVKPRSHRFISERTVRTQACDPVSDPPQNPIAHAQSVRAFAPCVSQISPSIHFRRGTGAEGQWR
ncbi:hypothetical protein DENSPDRAFT_836084 [Dentipellis sp. KUC8613]|nr:hypothetical protein DENSPDRAFT_836084 [Dentipellis sp. KUC8613]